MKFKTRYDSKKSKILFKDKSLTHQSFRDETNINNIVKKALKTGMLPQIQSDNAQYGDFSSVPDYLEALNIIEEAENRFSSLSSDLRKQFNNDPANFLEFVSDKENNEKLYELGLKARPQSPPKQQEGTTVPDTGSTEPKSDEGASK